MSNEIQGGVTIDQQRLVRLTAMVRVIWPKAEEVAIRNGHGGTDPWTAFVKIDGDVVLDICAPNDRAADALEAALVALLEPTGTGR